MVTVLIIILLAISLYGNFALLMRNNELDLEFHQYRMDVKWAEFMKDWSQLPKKGIGVRD